MKNGADFQVAVDRPLMLMRFIDKVAQDNWFTPLWDFGYQAYLTFVIERHVNAEERAVCFVDQIFPDLAVLLGLAIGVVGGTPRLAEQPLDVAACGIAYLDLQCLLYLWILRHLART